MIQLSEGAKTPLASALANTFRFGCILVYGTPRAASANHATTGTLLARITPFGLEDWVPDSGVGLEFIAINGYLLKNPVQTWQLTAVAGGTAVWWRLVGNRADTVASLTLPRLDGDVSTTAAPTVGLVLPSLEIAPADSREVEEFVFTFY